MAQPSDSSSPPPASAPAAPPAAATTLAELAWAFLRLGATAFGGPAAHIALMEDQFVVRRRWLTHQQLLDLLGATNLIPGPNSTELAMHIGQTRRGFPGLLVAGACFIAPAMLIVMGLAWVYMHFGAKPEAQGFLAGVKPVMIAIVVQALYRLGQTALKSSRMIALGLLATLACALGVHELLVLAAAGLLALLLSSIPGAPTPPPPPPHAPEPQVPPAAPSSESSPPPPPSPAVAPLALASTAGLSTGALASAGTLAAAGGGAVAFSLPALALFFLKVGAVLFGSGYVLLAFLEGDLVDRWHWLTEAQLLDAIAVGQVTPGPILTTATFVGYLLGGPVGAVVATLAIFAPAFFFVSVSGPLIPRLSRWRPARAILDGVNVGSLALMVVVTFQLMASAVVDGLTLALALASAVLLFRFRINSMWLMLAGAAAGGIRVWVG